MPGVKELGLNSLPSMKAQNVDLRGRCFGGSRACPCPAQLQMVITVTFFLCISQYVYYTSHLSLIVWTKFTEACSEELLFLASVSDFLGVVSGDFKQHYRTKQSLFAGKPSILTYVALLGEVVWRNYSCDVSVLTVCDSTWLKSVFASKLCLSILLCCRLGPAPQCCFLPGSCFGPSGGWGFHEAEDFQNLVVCMQDRASVQNSEQHLPL